MAAVKKSAKLNFYKFVTPKKMKVEAKDAGVLQEGINKNTQALNNIGKTLNSLGAVLTEFRDAQAKMVETLTAQQKVKFTPVYAKPTGGPKMDLGDGEQKLPETQMPGFLEAIFNLVKDFIILAFAAPALKWLSDPSNRETIQRVVSFLITFVKVISGFITTSMENWVNSMYEILRDDLTWSEKLPSIIKAFVNFAKVFLAIRWLKNPLNLVKDLKTVLGLFAKGLKGALFMLTKRTKMLAVGAALVGAGVLLYKAMKSDEGKEAASPTDDPPPPAPEAAKGGFLPQLARGGWISGPMSGYPVSLTGQGTDFIGHGTEYVAKRSDGGFVIPFDTPATRTNPGLTERRIGEASSKGFDLSDMFGSMGGFSQGGPLLPERAGGGAVTLTGVSKQRVGNDKEFLKRVNEVSAKIGANPADLLGLMASESGLNPQARNKSGATGLIQFMPGTARGLGTSTAALYRMNRVQQMDYVEKFLTKFAPRNPTPGHLYTSVFLPAFAKKPANYVVAKRGGFRDDWGHHPAAWYSANSGLDLNKDGSITIAELGQRIKQKQKSFGIGGGSRIDVSDIASTDTGVTPAAGAAAPQMSFKDALGSFAGSLFDLFGAKKDEKASKNAPVKESGAGSKEGNKANLKQDVKPKVITSAAASAKPQAQTSPSSAGGSAAPTVTKKTEDVANAKRDTRDGQVAALRAIQQQQATQAQRVAAISKTSLQTVQKAESAANNKLPTIVSNGGARKRSLIDQLESDNALMRSRG